MHDSWIACISGLLVGVVNILCIVYIIIVFVGCNRSQKVNCPTFVVFFFHTPWIITIDPSLIKVRPSNLKVMARCY